MAVCCTNFKISSSFNWCGLVSTEVVLHSSMHYSEVLVLDFFFPFHFLDEDNCVADKICALVVIKDIFFSYIMTK